MKNFRAYLVQVLTTLRMTKINQFHNLSHNLNNSKKKDNKQKDSKMKETSNKIRIEITKKQKDDIHDVTNLIFVLYYYLL